MKAHRFRWAVALLAVLLVASLVATGCGKKGAKSGAGKAATSAKGLDFVPSKSFMYMVVDTNFKGKNWKKFEHHAAMFPGYTEGRDSAIDEIFSDTDFTYADDIEPWLGESFGIGVISADMSSSDSSDVEVVAWADVKDEDKAEKFIKKDSKEKGTSKHKGYTIHETESDGDTMFWTMKDKVLVFSDSEDSLKKAIDANESGKGITDNEDASSVAEQISGDTLAAMVITGDGMREIVKEAASEAGGESLGSVTDLEQLDALTGVSIGLEVEDNGLRMHGYAGFDADKLDKGIPQNFAPTLMQELPADTVAALTMDDLGGTFGEAFDAATKDNDELQTQIAQVEAALDVKLKDVEDLYAGQSALALRASEGPLPGVAMIGEAKDEEAASGTLTKLVGFAAASKGMTATEEKFGDVTASKASMGMFDLIAAVTDGKSIMTNDGGFIEALGGDTLGDADTFTTAWDDAGAPDKVGGAFFLDTRSAITLLEPLGMSGAAGAMPIGPMVGWLENADDHIAFDLYVTVTDEGMSDSMDEMDTTSTSMG